MQSVKIGDCELFLVGTIHGLVSDREKVKSAFGIVKPDSLALAVAAEDIPALDALNGTSEVPPQDIDDDFLEKVSKYGKVELPPADLLEAYRLAKSAGIPVYSVDLDDNSYADEFCKHVSTWALVWQSLRTRRMLKRRYKAKTAEEFSHQWDRLHNKVKGFRCLEEAREKKIADELRAICAKHKKILAVVDIRRENGILEKLR
ncbi:MAG: hypothetical protein PHH26_08125 [Candidatus Thermoplasmatota archaeon]|nr:hypothetical protein [Candidatus Thermoplasmatota archaeon]